MGLYIGGGNNLTLLSSDNHILLDSNGLSMLALPEISKKKIILNNVVYRLNINLNSKEGE